MSVAEMSVWRCKTSEDRVSL